MAIKTEMILTDGKSIKCNCGKKILTISTNIQLVIPYLSGKCFRCGSSFVFDKLYIDNNKSPKLNAL